MLWTLIFSTADFRVRVVTTEAAAAPAAIHTAQASDPTLAEFRCIAAIPGRVRVVTDLSQAGTRENGLP